MVRARRTVRDEEVENGRGRAGRCEQGLSRRHPRRRPHGPRDRRRRVHGPRRTLRLRQDDGIADGRRPGGDLGGHGQDRRPHRQRSDPARARHRDGLPELRAVPPPLRLRQHRVQPQAAQGAEGGDRQAGTRRGAHPRPRAVSQAQAEGALGRPATARGDGPRDRAPAVGVPHGRAALQPRRQAPRADASRDLQSSSATSARRRST